MNEKEFFENITRTEYVVSEGGYKIPYSEFDRPNSYYEKFDRSFTQEEYVQMCKFKDRNTALFDKRWKSAKEVIDLIAYEVGVDPEKTDFFIYAPKQDKDGNFYSPLVEKLKKFFDKSGDKVKMKKQIAQLEGQLEALRQAIRFE